MHVTTLWVLVATDLLQWARNPCLTRYGGLHDGREFIASDVKGDERTDVAIVRIQGAKDLVPLALGDSDRIEVGDWVLAVGSPFGLDLSVTAGIISAKGRGPGIAEREDFLQTDAAINPGNSGGPLLDLKGQVVGINTAIATSTRSSAGVGFAVPVNMVRWVSRQLIDSGKVKRAWLGVGVEAVNAQVAQKHKAKLGRGTIVGQVMQGSPAEKAGVQSNDIILKFNSQDVAGPRSLQGIVERLEVGKSYAMRILRNGKNLNLKVTVAEMPDRSSRPTPPPPETTLPTDGAREEERVVQPASLLTQSGIGQSTCVSIGGDPIVGSTFLDLLPLYEADSETKAVVLFCEPGGTMEEQLAEHVRTRPSRLPLVAFVAGRFADRMQGVRFGHAGAIVEGTRGSPAGKMEVLRKAGVRVAEKLSQIPKLVRQALDERQ